MNVHLDVQNPLRQRLLQVIGQTILLEHRLGVLSRQRFVQKLLLEPDFCRHTTRLSSRLSYGSRTQNALHPLPRVHLSSDSPSGRRGIACERPLAVRSDGRSGSDRVERSPDRVARSRSQGLLGCPEADALPGCSALAAVHRRLTSERIFGGKQCCLEQPGVIASASHGIEGSTLSRAAARRAAGHWLGASHEGTDDLAVNCFGSGLDIEPCGREEATCVLCLIDPRDLHVYTDESGRF